MRTGTARLRRHSGHCPPWLFERMQRLDAPLRALRGAVRCARDGRRDRGRALDRLAVIAGTGGGVSAASSGVTGGAGATGLADEG